MEMLSELLNDAHAETPSCGGGGAGGTEHALSSRASSTLTAGALPPLPLSAPSSTFSSPLITRNRIAYYFTFSFMGFGMGYYALFIYYLIGFRSVCSSLQLNYSLLVYFEF